MTSTESLSSECDKIIPRNETIPLNHRFTDKIDSLWGHWGEFFLNEGCKIHIVPSQLGTVIY